MLAFMSFSWVEIRHSYGYPVTQGVEVMLKIECCQPVYIFCYCHQMSHCLILSCLESFCMIAPRSHVWHIVIIFHCFCSSKTILIYLTDGRFVWGYNCVSD